MKIDEVVSNLETLEQDLKDRYDLRSISLFLTGTDLKINMIAVKKDKLGQGIGTKVMQEICDFADKNGYRTILTTGTKDKGFGTTSSSRLKKFYKKFGFVENKGKNKDFSISENMFRLPRNKDENI